MLAIEKMINLKKQKNQQLINSHVLNEKNLKMEKK
jgi:hypothetical protein